MIDPHPALPAAEGWRIPALAPQDATWVQLGYPRPGFTTKPTIVIAHWACDMSGEEQPPFKGWFCASIGYGGKVHGFHEAPSGWLGWRPLWPGDRAAEAEAHDARLCSLHQAMAHEILRRRRAEAAVLIAGVVFARYADQHAAKGTPEGDAKAAANRDLMLQMQAALDPDGR